MIIVTLSVYDCEHNRLTESHEHRALFLGARAVGFPFENCKYLKLGR
jgi:hypothetical protein